MTPNELKKTRKKLKMSRDEIAEEFEMGKRTYVQRENGEMPIDRKLEHAVRSLSNLGKLPKKK